MSDINTQIRDYFEANIERVTAEDVLAGERVIQQVRPVRQRWTPTPRLAVGLGFAMTALVVGGSISFGLLIRSPGEDVAADGTTITFASGTPDTTGWVLLGIAAVLALLAVVFIVMARRSSNVSRRTRKEPAMATTFDTPPVDHRLEESHRTNRWLVAAVVVLAVALVALGAWVISDLTTEDESAVPAEIETLLEDYATAWNNYDAEAFRSLIIEDGYIHMARGTILGADAAADNFVALERAGFIIETVGDPMMVGDGDATKYIVFPTRIKQDSDIDGDVGFSVLTVKDTGDGTWKVARHVYEGEFIA